MISALFVFTLLLSDFFDTLGTMTAIGAEAGLLDEEGMPQNTQRILIVDSLAAVGRRRRRASRATRPTSSLRRVWPTARAPASPASSPECCSCSRCSSRRVVAIVPNEAAVPALVLVGFLMMQQVRGIDWDDLEVAIPAFLTIVLMPFTYSISVGIGAGFVAYVLLKLVRGKAADVHPLMWFVAALFIVYFAIHPLTDWLT